MENLVKLIDEMAELHKEQQEQITRLTKNQNDLIRAVRVLQLENERNHGKE